MGLFNTSQLDSINAVAAKSKEVLEPPKVVKAKSINDDLNAMSEQVIEYFKDSEAILITTEEDLHNYVSKCLEVGYAGIDTETTGLDRIKDHIVGASLYTPGMPECYIPMKHLVPIFDTPCKGQLTYEQVGKEFQRFADEKSCKLIFANADFDLAMIYNWLKVDLNDAFYYDVILAWRCLKENEKDNALKVLYNKYVLKGKGHPMKFQDFFSVKLFPYSKPEVAMLYAANDAKITYELFKWQLPYVTVDHPKCKKAHLEAVAELVWNVEMPMVKVCQNMNRTGIYLDKDTASVLVDRYKSQEENEKRKLSEMIDDMIANSSYSSFSSDRPFRSGKDFNPKSTLHVKYLVYKMMNVTPGKDGQTTDKSFLHELNQPVTNQILKVRSLGVLISTFVDKMPKATTPDSRIHAEFRQIGADTGRMCIAEDTEITVLNGKKKIQDIVPGDMVYCYADDGSLQLSKVKNLWLTGENSECVDIKWQSSGKGDIGHLICTPEHRILMKDGTWVEAKDLKRYDKVAHLRRTEPETGEMRPNLYGWNNLSTREQDVVKYSIFGCTDSANYVIHHVDGDPRNNCIENLELLPISNHTSYHTKEMISKGTHRVDHLRIPEVVERRRVVQNAKYVERVIKSRDNLIQMIQDAEGRISKVNMDYSTFLRRCEIAGIDVDAECRKYNPRYHKQHVDRDEFKRVYELYNGLAVKITEFFHISYDKFYKYCNEYGISRNHMIQSVTPAGKYRVYDIEVEGYHNFIASEICVHNSSSNPNLQNIPSHATDIRHMFRATPGYVMLSSDYSQQEPKITAFVSQDPKMIDAFKKGRDIYSTIASLAFNKSYEDCLEFHPETHEYQPEGKARRGEAKTILLGLTYGRSVPSIAEQLYGTRDDMSEEDKVKGAQKIYDSVLNAFPDLRKAMLASQNSARSRGYTETILGRRRHLPDMQLKEFEFVPMKGYVNPDIDPLDPETLKDKSAIPERIVRQLEQEFKSYKYFGQIARRTRELYDDEKIRVINNRPKINDATRQCLNGVIQGSAADMTKLAILRLENNDEWKRIGGRLLVPVHDELICEVPIDRYEDGARILEECMCGAADFLPFPITCDVTTSLRWYGLEYPCKYTKPSSLSNISEDEVKWVQYQLCELEYPLPVLKEADGSKPRGDAASGVNGVVTDEYLSFIDHYKNRYNITSDIDFINHIEKKVIKGVVA